ncbi:MAG TPA: trehalose-phosphatase [Mycobacteriales bacterium]|jgi:trehalose 6-phosphate phosphatase|nr:trehalose-phosphatase [Mycobacteriales bacterium]
MLPRARTDAGAAGLAALTADPGRAVLALDYDGTLAPIVRRPEDAVPAPGAVAALAACAAAFGTVAIVTGRPAEVVVGLSGAGDVEGLVVLGHYGEERWTAATGLVAPPEHPGLARARALLAGRLPDGTRLEEKGLSVALHTRAAADPDAALAEAEAVARAVAAETGLELNHGRYLVELRAPGARDKRAAVEALVAEREPAALLFAGDDLVDRPAYEAVAAFRESGGASVGVFVDNPEAAEVRDLADVVVPDPAACVALLRDLAAAT